MSEVKATEAAKSKAEELNVDLKEVEPSGSDGQATVEDVKAAAADQDKILYIANPALVQHSAKFVLEDGSERDFYQDPNLNLDGPAGQMLTEEEANKPPYSGEVESVRIIVPLRGGE